MPVERRVAGSGEGEGSAVEPGGRVRAGNPRGVAGSEPGREASFDARGDDRQPGTRLGNQPRLGKGGSAATDDDHGLAFHPHENGEGVEPLSVTGHARGSPRSLPDRLKRPAAGLERKPAAVPIGFGGLLFRRSEPPENGVLRDEVEPHPISDLAPLGHLRYRRGFARQHGIRSGTSLPAARSRPGRGSNQEEPKDMGDITLRHGIWVVVADGEKALFLRNEGDATYPNCRSCAR